MSDIAAATKVLPKCDALEAQGLKRVRIPYTERDAAHITLSGQRTLNFGSNDYLGLAQHVDVKNAFIKGVGKFGFGGTSSPLITGYATVQKRLEEAFAEFLNRERALLFSSGYLANVGVISALANRKQTILSDKLCHASLIDGIVLSRAKSVRYRHQDLAHLETLSLKHNPDFIVTESVFSMEGNLTPCADIVKIAQSSEATLILDDAHALGILGQNGAGMCEQYHLDEKDVPCLISPLGKAFAGVGAIVSGSYDLIEMILQTARTYRYSTALPPAMCTALLTVLHLIKTEAWRRQKLQDNIQFFIAESERRGLAVLSTDATPIKPILVRDNHKALQAHQALKQQGLFVPAIRPPSVPHNTARLRISLSCQHRKTHITQLLNALESVLNP